MIAIKPITNPRIEEPSAEPQPTSEKPIPIFVEISIKNEMKPRMIFKQ
jgi:hypothetical protein